MTATERDTRETRRPPDTLEAVREDIARTRGDLAVTLTSLRRHFALRERAKRRVQGMAQGIWTTVRHPRGGE